MITLSEAKALRHGTILYHVERVNSRGEPQRWRVSGMPKTWKRSPERVRVPVKHGLYDNDYLDENSLSLVCLDEDEARAIHALKGATS